MLVKEGDRWAVAKPISVIRDPLGINGVETYAVDGEYVVVTLRVDGGQRNYTIDAPADLREKLAPLLEAWKLGRWLRAEELASALGSLSQ